MTRSIRPILLVGVCAALLATGCSSEGGDAPAPPDSGAAPDASPPAVPMPMPMETTDAGAPDAAPPPLDVPASLVKALGGKSYVEESCQSTTYPGWPYAAQKCTYQTNLVVTIANPDADRVGAGSSKRPL